MPPISELRLRRVALVSLGIIVIGILLVTLVVTAYATYLAIQAQGATALAESTSKTETWRWRMFSIGSMIGLVFGTYPALRASRLDPIEALRHD